MATYDQVSAITEKYFVKELADNIFDSVVLLNRAKGKFTEEIGGGERILMPLSYAQTSASGWYNGADTLSTTDNPQIQAAELLWKQSYANITISRREELQNSGEAQIISLVKAKMKLAEQTLRDVWGTGLYNAGTTTNAILGLRLWLSTSSTCGGISQSSNSWWQAQVDSTTTTLSLAAMQSIYESCTIDNMAPTVITAGRTVFNIFHALLTPQERFIDKSSADAGFTSLFFRATPVLADSKCPAYHMCFLNEKTMHLFLHKDEMWRFEPFQKPINQNVQVAKIYTMGAFGLDNCRLNGLLSGITA